MNHVHNIYSEKQVKENIDNQEGDEIVSLYICIKQMTNNQTGIMEKINNYKTFQFPHQTHPYTKQRKE